jgi:hypothetical protein
MQGKANALRQQPNRQRQHHQTNKNARKGQRPKETLINEPIADGPAQTAHDF